MVFEFGVFALSPLIACGGLRYDQRDSSSPSPHASGRFAVVYFLNSILTGVRSSFVSFLNILLILTHLIAMIFSSVS